MENKFKIIFIVGNSRSGTTLMSRILGNNPNIFTFHELHFYGKQYEPSKNNIQLLDSIKSKELFAKLLCIQREGYFAPCKELSKYKQEISSVLTDIKKTPEEIYLDFLAYETNNNNKNIACEQTPRNLYHLDKILNIPADIKIINMVRDPRDVLLSQKTKWKRKFLGANRIPFRESFRSWVNYHPITIALLWKSAINEIEKYHNNKCVQSVKFEELLLTPELLIKNLCSFLNINFSNNMLIVPQIGSSEVPDTNKFGINQNRINPWKNSKILKKTEIFICEKICRNQMKRMDYHFSQYKPSIIILCYLLIIFPIKIFFSMLVNIQRYKNLKIAILQRVGNIRET